MAATASRLSSIDESEQDLRMARAQFENEANGLLEEIDKLEQRMTEISQGFIKELKAFHNAMCDSFDQHAEDAGARIEQLRKLSDRTNSIIHIISEFREHALSFS
jgi:hypothetical protein